MISVVELLAIQSIQGIGDQTLRRIIKSSLSVKDIEDLDNASLTEIFNNQKSIDSFFSNWRFALSNAEEELDKYKDNGMEVIHYFSEYYPPLLKLIDDFPIFLFCKGNIELLKSSRNIAVIGTRDCSEVGVKIAHNTAAHFAENGYTIVSGLAKGIDAIGHKAALDVQGKTIAVLIDIGKIYPKENADLANRILDKEGLLIAENKVGSFQGKNAFVLRDRIQSGLSLAIFPIETDIIGGTMHTVKYATKQKRFIFVPNIYNPVIKNQYEITVGSRFSKINGIRELIDTKRAIPYIKDDYGIIKIKLLELENLLITADVENKIKDSKDDSDLTSNLLVLHNRHHSVKDNKIDEPQITHLIKPVPQQQNEVEELPELNIEQIKSQAKEEIKNGPASLDKINQFEMMVSEFKVQEKKISEKIKELSGQLSECKKELKEVSQLKSSIEKLFKEISNEGNKKKPTRKSKGLASLFNEEK